MSCSVVTDVLQTDVNGLRTRQVSLRRKKKSRSNFFYESCSMQWQKWLVRFFLTIQLWRVVSSHDLRSPPSSDDSNRKKSRENYRVTNFYKKKLMYLILVFVNTFMNGWMMFEVHMLIKISNEPKFCAKYMKKWCCSWLTQTEFSVTKKIWYWSLSNWKGT